MRLAERNPYIRIGLRLAFHKAVASVRPQQNVVGLIIKDQFAAIGFDRENGMTVAGSIAHHGDKQRLARPSRLHQHAPLLQHVVFAIAVAVVGIIPAFDNAPMIHIGHRLDVGVDP